MTDIQNIHPERPAHLRLKTGLRFGIVTSMLNSLIGIALYSMGLMDFSGSGGGWTSLLLFGLGIYLASEHFKKFTKGSMSQSDVVVISLWIGFFSGIVSVIVMLIQLKLDPSIMEKMYALMEMQFEKQDLEGEQYDKAMEMATMFMSPGFLSLMGFISSMFIALIEGFILSFILRKEQDPFA
jgi:hypothetical protein